MKKTALLITVPTLSLALAVGAVLITATLPVADAGGPDEDHQLPARSCEWFTFSSCPSSCVRECIPSECDLLGTCTLDCDGPGSCSSPSRPDVGGDD